MIAFIKQNAWKILPLGMAILLWTIGYVFRFYEPLATSTCDSFYGEYCMSAVGTPLLALSQWLVASAVVILFARFDETVQRWSIFAGIYLLATAVVLAFSPVSSGGFGFQERLVVAQFLGLIFLIITILWVTIHTVVLRRRKVIQ